MIIFSPRTKFTMQRICDCVANGAYFYFKFEYSTENRSIENLLEKLTERYDLHLTPRQRNYRLEKGLPICTLIVQRHVYDEDHKWLIFVLFTTPKSRDFNAVHGIDLNKISDANAKTKLQKMKNELGKLKWNKDDISQELQLIQSHFKDNEPKQFVLTQPIFIEPIRQFKMELIRDPHKIYKHASGHYKEHIRPYSWTWRYTKSSYEALKTRLVFQTNKLLSEKAKSKIQRNQEAYIETLCLLRTWSVFKANRSQAGRIIHFSRRFLQRRAKRSWMKMELPAVSFEYLSRLPTYADCIYEYQFRREWFIHFQIEIPRAYFKMLCDNADEQNITLVASDLVRELELGQEQFKEVNEKLEQITNIFVIDKLYKDLEARSAC